MKYQYSNQNSSWKLHRACSGSNMPNQGPRYGIDKFRQKNKQTNRLELPSGKLTYLAGISPLSIGNASSKGPFSLAMLDYRSVIYCKVACHLVLEKKLCLAQKSPEKTLESQQQLQQNSCVVQQRISINLLYDVLLQSPLAHG